MKIVGLMRAFVVVIICAILLLLTAYRGVLYAQGTDSTCDPQACGPGYVPEQQMNGTCICRAVDCNSIEGCPRPPVTQDDCDSIEGCPKPLPVTAD